MATFISDDGTEIAFSKEGKGPALILVDGAFCYRDHGVTPRIKDLLTSHFTVYSYDRRGRGESNDRQPYTVTKEVSDLNGLIKLTGEAPYIAGFSSGAALLMHALHAGINAKKVAFFEPPFTNSVGDGSSPGAALTALNTHLQNANKSEAVRYFMKNVMGMPAFVVTIFKLFARESWNKNESVADTLPYEILILDDFRVPRDKLSDVKVPAIVIGGEKSPRKLREAVEATATALPKGKTVWLKGQSHNTSMKVLAPVLIDFFKGS